MNKKIDTRSMIKSTQTQRESFKNPNLDIQSRIFGGNKTQSFLFLLPLTGFNLKKYQSCLKNVFCDDINKPVKTKNAIYLLCKDDEEVRKHLISLPRYVYNYYVGYDDDCKYFMYVFSTNLEEDYILIKNGLYSETSNSYKHLTKMFIYDQDYDNPETKDTNKNMHTVLWRAVDGILYKRKWLKGEVEKKIDSVLSENQEYWPGFNSTNEVFNKINKQ